jgi:hypothetical protein
VRPNPWPSAARRSAAHSSGEKHPWMSNSSMERANSCSMTTGGGVSAWIISDIAEATLISYFERSGAASQALVAIMPSIVVEADAAGQAAAEEEEDGEEEEEEEEEGLLSALSAPSLDSPSSVAAMARWVVVACSAACSASAMTPSGELELPMRLAASIQDSVAVV